MARRRWLYLTVLVSCLVFYIAYQEWLSFFLLVLTALVPWLSLLLTLPAIFRFRAEVSAPPAVEMGIPLTVRLMGGCDLPVPPFRGRLRATRLFTGASQRQKNALNLATDHCGGITITPEKVRICDYLGLFSLPVKSGGTRTVLVRPRPRAIRQLPSLEKYLARNWRPKRGGGFAENHELRLYRPGDSLNQVHWKLTAKTGKLILREPMEPERGLILVTMTLRGTPQALDEKLGRLLWLGTYLLSKNLPFELRVLTGGGLETWAITGEKDLREAVDRLLCAPLAEGSLQGKDYRASWHYHIRGDSDET